MWTPSLSKGKPFPVTKMPVEVWAIGDFRFKGIPGISKVNAGLHICTNLTHHELRSVLVFLFFFVKQAQASYTCIAMSWYHMMARHVRMFTMHCEHSILCLHSFACLISTVLSSCLVGKCQCRTCYSVCSCLVEVESKVVSHGEAVLQSKLSSGTSLHKAMHVS